MKNELFPTARGSVGSAEGARLLTQLISAVPCFGAAAGKRLRELDLNPALLSRENAVAVDWRMLLDDSDLPEWMTRIEFQP